MPPDHWDIWRYLLDNQFRYPEGLYVPPFRNPKAPDFPRGLVTAAFVLRETDILGFPQPVELAIYDGERTSHISLSGSSDDSEAICSLLFSFSNRGRLVVFPEGNVRDFRVLASRYCIPIASRGYVVQPLNAGSNLIAIKIRKKRHSWTLADFEAVTGIQHTDAWQYVESLYSARNAEDNSLQMFHSALCAIQTFLIRQFQTSLKITISSAAIKAAARSLPSETWKWRPDPLLVTLCRLGGAYRGGYSTGRGYRGNAWLVDTNRLYTWCLTRQLPIRAAFGKAYHDGVLRDGIYVCTIRGPGVFPVYVPVWGNASRGFTNVYWNGDVIHTVLCSNEIDGITALGYRVEAWYGFRFIQSFNLAAHVERIVGIINGFGKDSPWARFTKPIGNSVYGKWGESPTRIDTCFSSMRPGHGYYPFVDSAGVEIDNLWERSYDAYRSHQHVDIAATITGYGRGHIYRAIADIIAHRGFIAATNTDSIITNINPAKTDMQFGESIGQWRNIVHDRRGLTVARNAWAIGNHVALSGSPKRDRAIIERLAAGETVVTHGIQKAPPIPEGPIAREYSFTTSNAQ